MANNVVLMQSSNMESSFSCDTSMLQECDLNMYADIIEHMGVEPTLKKRKLKKKSKQSNKRHCYDIVMNNNFDSPLDQTHLTDETIEESLNSINIDDIDLSQIVHQFNNIFSYFDEDVNLNDSLQAIESTDNKENCCPLQRVESIRRSYTPAANHINANALDSPAKPSNCGRLSGLVNLFENFDILSAEKRFEKKENLPQEFDENNNNASDVQPPTGRVKHFAKLYQQRIAQNKAGHYQQRVLRELPSSPPPGKFEVLRRNLEQFFNKNYDATKMPASAVHSEPRTYEYIVPATDAIDDMFVKYNKLRNIKTLLETQKFMKQCHQICTDMSEKLLCGLEDSILLQENQLYRYFQTLAVNNFV